MTQVVIHTFLLQYTVYVIAIERKKILILKQLTLRQALNTRFEGFLLELSVSHFFNEKLLFIKNIMDSFPIKTIGSKSIFTYQYSKEIIAPA